MASDVEKYLVLGKQKFFQYDRKGAADEFRKALAIEPDNQTILGWLACSLAILHQYDEAIDLLKDVEASGCAEILISKGIIANDVDLDEKKAFELFNKAISIDPNHDYAYIERGFTHADANNYSAALADFESALKVTQNSYIYALLGRLKRNYKDFNGALADLDMAINLDNNNVRALEDRAWVRYKLDDKTNALVDYNKVIELDPSNPKAWKKRGDFQFNTGIFEEAIENYDVAIKLDPEYASAIDGRGISRFKIGKKNLAINDFNKAIEIEPKYSEGYAHRGMLLEDIGKTQEALDDYNLAIEHDPDYSWAWYRRARNKFFILNDLDGAEKDYSQAIALDPKNEFAWGERGELYKQIGKTQEALSDFNKSIELNSNYAWVRAHRGILLKAMGKTEEALVEFNKAIEIDANDGWTVAERGLLLKVMGQTQKALVDFDKSIELDPSNEWAWANRGLLRKQLCDSKGALNDFNRALSLNRNYTWALVQRAQLLKSLGQYELSLVDRARYYELEGIRKIKYDDPEAQDVFDHVYEHLHEVVKPGLENNGEKLIEYWECLMHWGAETLQSLYEGSHTYTHLGWYGIGYVCLSDKYLRIFSIGHLSNKYSKIFRIGILKWIGLALFKNFAMQRTEKNDKDWKISFNDIQAIIKEDQGLKLVTSSEVWTMGSYFNETEYMLSALEYARTGNIRKAINLGSSLPGPGISSSDEEIFAKIRQLASLRDDDIISNEDFEKKKKQLLAKL